MEATGPQREDLEGELKSLLDVRAAIRTLRHNEERIADRLRYWLTAHPDETLFDPETGIKGWLESRSDGKPRPCDLLALYENNEPLFWQLVKTNSLQINPAGLKAAGALVGGIERYLGPQGQSTVLHVQKED